MTKNEKNRTWYQNVRNFVRNVVTTFFFRFSTRFDPLLAILLVLGGRAILGESGQKDLEKIRKTTKKSPKMKKLEHGIKMCGILSGMSRQLFFFDFGPILAHSRPFFCSWAVGPI